jgi:uncharacterized protein (DUF433 family)
MAMITKSLDKHIEITPGCKGGKPCIKGRRITVQNIVIWHEYMGKSVDEIATEYDLELADIYAALAYYFDYREELDREMDESIAFVNALRTKTPSKLKQKLQEQKPHATKD